MKNNSSSAEEIVIVTVCDNHYAPMLAALLKSIELSYTQENTITVFIISDSISKRNLGRLRKSVDNKLLNLNVLDMEDCIPSGVRLPRDYSSYPLNIYTRIFIPTIVPSHISKVLYLDVDTLFLADICGLWDTSLDGYHAAAVQDPIIPTVSNHWGGILNYTDFSLSADTPYFNTGVLLINTKKWLADNISQQIIEVISSNKKYANYPDQYGMNVVLANRWKILDPSWNTFSNEVRPDANLIHFTSRKPIYKSYEGNTGYQKIFFDFLNQTEWRNFDLIGEPRRYYKKIRNVLEKLRGLFLDRSH